MAVGSKPTERCQSCHHRKKKLREKLPGKSHCRYYVEYLDHRVSTFMTDTRFEAREKDRSLFRTDLHLVLSQGRVQLGSTLHAAIQCDLLKRRGKDELWVINQDSADCSIH